MLAFGKLWECGEEFRQNPVQRVLGLAMHELEHEPRDAPSTQPLARLSIPGTLPPDLLVIVADEVNVKDVVPGAAEIMLDTVLTPELVREGDVRAFARAVAEARKDQGYSPKDLVRVTVAKEGRDVLEGIALPGLKELSFGEGGPYAAELSFGKVAFALARDAA